MRVRRRVRSDLYLSTLREFQPEKHGRYQGITGKISSVCGASRIALHAACTVDFYFWFRGMTKTIRLLIKIFKKNVRKHR